MTTDFGTLRSVALLTCCFVGCEGRTQTASQPWRPQLTEVGLTFDRTASPILTMRLSPDGPDWHFVTITDPELPCSAHLTELRFNFAAGTIQMTFATFAGDDWHIEFEDHKAITNVFDGKPRPLFERALLELKQSYGNNVKVD